ncbi:hypothetical protein [Aminobacterium colombiense]|jgi:hypothetical protein
MTTGTRETLKELSLDLVRKYMEETNFENITLIEGATIVHNIYGEGEIVQAEVSEKGVSYLHIEFKDPSSTAPLVKKFPVKNVVEAFFSRLHISPELYSKICPDRPCERGEKKSPLEERSVHSRVLDTALSNGNGKSRQEILRECRAGDTVYFVVEEDHIFVVTGQQEQIGTLPREVAEFIFPALEKDLPVEAIITSIPREGTPRKRGCRLEVYLDVPGREKPTLKVLAEKNRTAERASQSDENEILSPEERSWNDMGVDIDEMSDEEIDVDIDPWEGYGGYEDSSYDS